MTTPIADFVARYANADPVRLHMPGHKGVGAAERLDLTEVPGADSLYEAAGIIKESEENASRLFGAHTFYTTEGSSHAIRAMLYLICLHAKMTGRAPTVLAGRNAHKTFIGAAALLDVGVDWLYPRPEEAYLTCRPSPGELRAHFVKNGPPVAVYLTSPDYLGHMADIAGISAVCREFGVLLAVDNAHGAYLRFLPQSLHPIDLGADLCCDSAHKTLPCLTGAAYLHLSHASPPALREAAKSALALFGSTSPSYLVLASLDRANAYLAGSYPAELAAHVAAVARLSESLSAAGLPLVGDEPMKLTLSCRPLGYTGQELLAYLSERGIECEFADPDYLVAMPTPALSEGALRRFLDALLGLPHRTPLPAELPPPHLPRIRMTVREAMLAPAVTLPTEACLGRTLATATVGCPPAVPILVSGEVVDEAALARFAYYGIDTLRVVSE
ncbi:MAG: amino acid decarboxylase [Clostridia bacterium]|nr:amino acid decarboxylase [Clostridia bacterium]